MDVKSTSKDVQLNRVKLKLWDRGGLVLAKICDGVLKLIISIIEKYVDYAFFWQTFMVSKLIISG